MRPQSDRLAACPRGSFWEQRPSTNCEGRGFQERPTACLGRQDSNLGMAESKSDLTTYLRAEAQRRTAARLGNISMMAVTRRQGTSTMLTPVIPVISCTIIVHGCQRAYAAYSLLWVPL